MAGEEGYVVVTISGDVVHVFGDDDGVPFPTRSRAQGSIRRFRASQEAMSHAPKGMVLKTCKIIKAEGDQPE